MKGSRLWIRFVIGICLLMGVTGRGDSQSSEPTFTYLKNVPPELERLLLKKDDIPGYEWKHSPAIAMQHRTGEREVGQGFYQERDESGKKIIRADIWYCPDLLTAVERVCTATITAAGPMPPGTMSNLPLGVDGSWWTGGTTEVGGKEVFANYILVFWKDQVVCAVRLYRVGTLIAEPLSEREMHLAENVARKILANMEGRPFKIVAAAPPTWNVMPVSLIAHGKEMKEAGKVVSYGGEVYAAPDALAALGLTVKAEKMPERPKDRREAFKEFYLNKVKTVEAERDKTNLKFEVGEKFYLLNGKRTPLDTPARLVDGVPMVPLEVAAKALNLSFMWDSQRHVARVG